MTELTQWLGEHQSWILLATCLLAFFESLALVGIVIPGVALLFATAAAAGSASVNLWQVLAAGFIGAVLGDGLSFLLGRHFHEKITRLPPFNKHPEWITKGELFFEKYGIASIVIGRFIGPIRPVMPLVAGMLEMPASRFYGINIVSALAWSPFYLLPGYFIGATTESQHIFQQQHFLLIAGILLLSWLTGLALIKIRGITQHTLHEHHQHNQHNSAAVVFVIAILLFIATYLATRQGWLDAFNTYALQQFTSTRLPILDYFFVAVTSLGYWLPMAMWATSISIVLIFQRKFIPAVIWVSAALTGQASISWLKKTAAITRPDITLQPPTSFAFPSGHTAITIVFLGTLILLARNSLSQQAYRRSIFICCFICILVATSRLYLGVHWVSDIIAGTCLGTMIVAGLYWLVHRLSATTNAFTLSNTTAPASSLLIATVVGIACGYLFVIVPEFSDNLKRYQLTEHTPHNE